MKHSVRTRWLEKQTNQRESALLEEGLEPRVRVADARTDRNITAHSSALIAQDSDIKGTISFGPGCIVHPKATVHALEGEIIFGKDCVVEEGARIIHRYVSFMP